MIKRIIKKTGHLLHGVRAKLLKTEIGSVAATGDEGGMFGLNRFVVAQDKHGIYECALREIRSGRKRNHWMWYVLPQLKGLGHTYKSSYYGISCRDEAVAYLAHEVLGERLRTVCGLLLEQAELGHTARGVMGSIDAKKTFSSLTLFDAVSPDDIFAQCLDRWFDGHRDERTLMLLQSAASHDGGAAATEQPAAQ